MRFWQFEIANCLISDSVFSWIHVAFLIKDFLDLLNLGQVHQNTLQFLQKQTNFCGFPIQHHPRSIQIYPDLSRWGVTKGRRISDLWIPSAIWSSPYWSAGTHGKPGYTWIRPGKAFQEIRISHGISHGTRVWDDPNKSQKSFRMSCLMFFFHLARLATFQYISNWWCLMLLHFLAVKERYTGVPPKWSMGH